MYLSGVSFFVLADHFLIHQSHAYEEAARRIEVRGSVFVRGALSDVRGSLEAQK